MGFRLYSMYVWWKEFFLKQNEYLQYRKVRFFKNSFRKPYFNTYSIGQKSRTHQKRILLFFSFSKFRLKEAMESADHLQKSASNFFVLARYVINTNGSEI